MKNSNISDTYITTGQAATILNVNRLTIQRWVKAKKITGYRVGHFMLISKEDVRNLLKIRTFGTAK